MKALPASLKSPSVKSRFEPLILANPFRVNWLEAPLKPPPRLIG